MLRDALHQKINGYGFKIAYTELFCSVVLVQHLCLAFLGFVCISWEYFIM